MPYATDEHGEVIPDPSTPRWVVTPEQHERWAECVRIAKAVTGQQENTIEVDNFAAAVFDMPNPTHPAGSSMGPRVVQEADLSPRTRNLLQRAADRRRRDRRGRWVGGLAPTAWRCRRARSSRRGRRRARRARRAR